MCEEYKGNEQTSGKTIDKLHGLFHDPTRTLVPFVNAVRV